MNMTGLIVVTLTALLVSLSSIFSRFAYDVGANPQTLVLFRFGLFCLLYLIIAAVSLKPISLPKGKRLYAILSGAFFTIGSGSLLASMFFLPVSLAIVIFYTYPILTMVGEKILNKQKPRVLEIACFILAFIGLVLALKLDTTEVNPIGIGLAITASLGMSTSYLISDKKLKQLDSFNLTFFLAATGLVIMAIFVLLSQSFNPGELSVSNALYVFLASFSFALAFFFMFKGISLIGAVKTAMILNLEPIFTIGLAFMFLNESLSGVQLIGATLVLIAIFTVQRFQSR